jgi:hypothetical protein
LYYAGLTEVDFGDGPQAICRGGEDGWPVNNVTGVEHELCKPLRAARTIYKVCAILCGISSILGLYYNLNKGKDNEVAKRPGTFTLEDPPTWVVTQIVLLIVSSSLTCVGYWIFDPEKTGMQLQTALRASVVENDDDLREHPESCFLSLGYTFVFVTMVWICPFTVLGTKTFFTNLENEVD